MQKNLIFQCATFLHIEKSKKIGFYWLQKKLDYACVNKDVVIDLLLRRVARPDRARRARSERVARVAQVVVQQDVRLRQGCSPIMPLPEEVSLLMF